MEKTHLPVSSLGDEGWAMWHGNTAEGGTSSLGESGRDTGCCRVAVPMYTPVYVEMKGRPIQRSIARAHVPGPGQLAVAGLVGRWHRWAGTWLRKALH